MPDCIERWLPMIMETTLYIIEQESSSSSEYTFDLPVAWLPDSIRKNANLEYLAWLQENGERAKIGKNGMLVVDAAYNDKEATS